jgi:hypothetical protein
MQKYNQCAREEKEGAPCEKEAQNSSHGLSAFSRTAMPASSLQIGGRRSSDLCFFLVEASRNGGFRWQGPLMARWAVRMRLQISFHLA